MKKRREKKNNGPDIVQCSAESVVQFEQLWVTCFIYVLNKLMLKSTISTFCVFNSIFLFISSLTLSISELSSVSSIRMAWKCTPFTCALMHNAKKVRSDQQTSCIIFQVNSDASLPFQKNCAQTRKTTAIQMGKKSRAHTLTPRPTIENKNQPKQIK